MSDPHAITDLASLEALYGAPSPRSITKVVHRITPEYRRLLEAAPLFALATSGPGGLDCSPRGDAGSSVTILDETTLLIPDRRGNNRLDSLKNIVEDPIVALLFFIPGCDETVRINGKATLTTDPALRAQLAVKGREPATVIKVEIGEMYFQCSSALLRSDIWNPEKHQDRASLPTAGELIKAGEPDFDAKTYDAELPARKADTLY